MGMGQFSTDLIAKYNFIDHSVIWTLHEPLVYIATDGTRIEIPSGFVTDLATVPRIFWSIFPTSWSYDPATVLHDYLLYSSEEKTQKDIDYANDMFEEAMYSVNVNKIQICVMMVAVRFHFFLKRIYQKIKHSSNEIYS
jgi:hypothetical protein